MKRSIAVLFVMAMAACSSTDNNGGGYGGGYGRGSGGRDVPRAEAPRLAGAGGLLELVPPDDWWRDPQIQVAVNVTSDQMKLLDDIGTKQQTEVVKMRQDSRVVIRDLRSVIESEHPQSEDVIAAGERVRKLRDELFDLELRLLDSERQVLSKTQWTALQDALQERRTERRDRGGPGLGGGRRGGRGRFPG